MHFTFDHSEEECKEQQFDHSALWKAGYSHLDKLTKVGLKCSDEQHYGYIASLKAVSRQVILL
jgi:hypothetical protein